MNDATAGTESDSTAPSPSRRWYHRIGPGLVTACVVIGPGSILTSTKVGAANGYSMAWVVLVSVAFMMVYVTLGAKLGAVGRRSPAELLTEKAGRWLAVLIGLSIFFIATAFQFGNNLGVASAFEVYVSDDGLALGGRQIARETVIVALVVIFNAGSLSFLFAFGNLYRALERMMTVFVGVMLAAFALNLCVALGREGMPSGAFEYQKGTLGIEVLGLIGTTFSIAAAYYQTYLVRQKGWTRDNLGDGLVDARVSGGVMAAITLVIMATSATLLFGRDIGKAIGELSILDVADQFRPTFGAFGQALFCAGLFSAAYSSFLVNSMIGGFVLSDGLGFGAKADSLAPKLFTAAALLVGMGVALYVVFSGAPPIAAIVTAQATTVVAAPLLAVVLLWLTNSRDVMGEDRNGLLMNALAGIGFVLLLAMAWYTAAYKVWPTIEELL